MQCRMGGGADLLLRNLNVTHPRPAASARHVHHVTKWGYRIDIPSSQVSDAVAFVTVQAKPGINARQRPSSTTSHIMAAPGGGGAYS